MEFDPKRAARVGAKMLRQREDCRLAKRRVRAYEDEYDDIDRESDEDSETKDFMLNWQASSNRKRMIND